MRLLDCQFVHLVKSRLSCVFFVVCVHFLAAILESFCKNRDFYDGDSEKKWGMVFFCGVKRKNRNVSFTPKKNKNKK